MTKVSATDGGIGSVATSAVPILANTRSTSGNCLMRASSVVCMPTAWSRLVPGMRSACSAMSPSSRLGMNSAAQARAPAARRRPPAARRPTTTARATRSAQLQQRLRSSACAATRSRGSPSPRPCRSTNSATAAGTKVSDSTIAAVSAMHHGERHRVEHLSLDAGEREDRQVHRGDDDHAEQAGPDHFGGGRGGQLEALVAARAPDPAAAAPRRSGAGSSRR